MYESDLINGITTDSTRKKKRLAVLLSVRVSNFFPMTSDPVF